MKIVVTGTRGIPNIMGGVETHCEELFPRIARKGFEVTVIRRKSYVRDTLSSYKGITLSDIETPRKKSLEAIVHTFRAIVRAKRLKADIVHLHAVGPALLTPLARLLGMKVVFTTTGRTTTGTNGAWRPKRHSAWARPQARSSPTKSS